MVGRFLNLGWSKQALTTLLRRTNTYVGRVGPATLSEVADSRVDFWRRMIGLAMRPRNPEVLREMAELLETRPEGGSAEDRAELARAVSELLEKTREMPKRSDEKK